MRAAALHRMPRMPSLWRDLAGSIKGDEVHVRMHNVHTNRVPRCERLWLSFQRQVQGAWAAGHVPSHAFLRRPSRGTYSPRTHVLVDQGCRTWSWRYNPSRSRY